jgi:large subunit ribosomal protein L11
MEEGPYPGRDHDLQGQEVHSSSRPPASYLLKKAAGIARARGPNKDKVGKVTRKQIEEIARVKLPDLNAYDIEAARKIIEGTARNMGLEIVSE